MTEENNYKILHYLKLKEKLSEIKTKRHNLNPSFNAKNSLVTNDSIISSSNNINYSNKINTDILPTNKNNIKPKIIGNNVKKIDYIYSPRTRFVLEKDEEEKLYHDLCIDFDPMTIKIMKAYFKERLGELNEIEFISILKNYLSEWYPNLPNREKIMVKLLSRLFKDIDLNCNEIITWEDFTEYLTYNSSNMNKKKLNYDLRMYTHSKKIWKIFLRMN